MRITKNTIFDIVNATKYFFFKSGLSLDIYLKLIRLAIDAINVPSPPIFVPTINAEILSVKPASKIAAGTLLITWLAIIAVIVSLPPIILISA